MRLLDIDTPEISKPGCPTEKRVGLLARDRLHQMIDQADKVEIRDSGQTDKYRRKLINLVLDGYDAGEQLVEEGFALRWRPGSKV